MNKINPEDIEQIKHLKAIFNIMGLEVSMMGIVNVLLAINLYEEMGEEATIRDVSKLDGEAKSIIEVFNLKNQNE
jgi:hypothetical protein